MPRYTHSLGPTVATAIIARFDGPPCSEQPDGGSARSSPGLSSAADQLLVQSAVEIPADGHLSEVDTRVISEWAKEVVRLAVSQRLAHLASTGDNMTQESLIRFTDRVVSEEVLKPLQTMYGVTFQSRSPVVRETADEATGRWQSLIDSGWFMIPVLDTPTAAGGEGVSMEGWD